MVHALVTEGSGVPCGCSPSPSYPCPCGLQGLHTPGAFAPVLAAPRPGSRSQRLCPRRAACLPLGATGCPLWTMVVARASLPWRPRGPPRGPRRAVPWRPWGAPGVPCPSGCPSAAPAGGSCLRRVPACGVAGLRDTSSLRGVGQGGVASRSGRWTGPVLDTWPSPAYDGCGGWC